jgi:hypothetical protein
VVSILILKRGGRPHAKHFALHGPSLVVVSVTTFMHVCLPCSFVRVVERDKYLYMPAQAQPQHLRFRLKKKNNKNNKIIIKIIKIIIKNIAERAASPVSANVGAGCRNDSKRKACQACNGALMDRFAMQPRNEIHKIGDASTPRQVALPKP